MIRILSRALPLILLCAVFSRSLSQQPAAHLQGVVLEEGSERPLGKATVELRGLSGDGPATATTVTDRDGRFYFPGLKPGAYRLSAAHAGHLNAQYGQRQPGVAGTPVTLTAGQSLSTIRILMIAGGVISGRITDKGKPIGLADVVAVKAIYAEGQLSMTPVLAVRTDDTGEFHLFWLPPGRYYIVGVIWDIATSVGTYVNPIEGAESDPFFAQRFIGRAVFMRSTASGIGENEAHVPVYYPGTPDPKQAKVIEVQPGGVVRGLEIDASPVRTRRVTGRVVGIPASNPAQPAQPVRPNVQMLPLTNTLTSSPALAPNVAADMNGAFEMDAVAPGRYLLTARAGNTLGRAVVEVGDRDVSGVVVSLLPGWTVSGRVIVERATAPAAGADPVLASLRVMLRTDPMLPGPTSYGNGLQPDGSFTLPASLPMPAGDYRVFINPILTAAGPELFPPAIPIALAKYYVKSVRMGDVDLPDYRLHLEREPQDLLTIVIGSNPGSLDGRVLDDRQQPVPGSTLVLIHDNGLRYHVNERVTFGDPSGRFEFQNVAPGNYKLFAWENVERHAWKDVDFMRNLETYGVPVRIDEGGKSSVDIRAIGK